VWCHLPVGAHHACWPVLQAFLTMPPPTMRASTIMKVSKGVFNTTSLYAHYYGSLRNASREKPGSLSNVRRDPARHAAPVTIWLFTMGSLFPR
jgi:hypothetical protein